jgi:hypothetical protein
MLLFSRLRSSLVALMALTLLPLLGCGGGEGKVTLLLTDAPGDFKKAVVTISEVHLQGGDDGKDGDSGRVVLMNTPVTTDLLTLANDTSTLVKDAVVPEGKYSELRFVITGGYVEVENSDGTTSIYASSDDYAGLPAGAKVAGKLQMPSLGTSGLKVKFDEALSIEGDQKILLVDFDVAQSFGHEAGNNGKWVMHPVIKAAEVTASGSINVTVAAGAGVLLPTVDGHQVTIGDFHAVAINAAGTREEVALSDANADGVFEAKFLFLVPGTFQIDLTTPAGVVYATNPAHPVTVELGSGKNLTQAFVITSASKQ